MIKLTFRVVICVSFLSNFAYAQTPPTTGTGERNTNSQVKMPAPAASQSTNSSAKEDKTQQLLGAGMNAASGAMFLSQCSSSAWWYCAMGAMALAQAATGLAAGKKAGQTQLASGAYDPLSDYDPSGPAEHDSAPGVAGLGEVGKITEQGLASLSRQGYVALPNGSVKLPDGRIVKASDFANAEAMAAAGVPSGSIGGALSGIAAASAEAMKKAGAMKDGGANVVSMGVDSGGGGGGGGRGPASEDSDSNLDDYLNKLKNPFGMDAGKRAQMVAGKTVTHGDDQIGVKVDDIFRMVHLRYQQRRAGDDFIEPATAANSAAAGGSKKSAATPKRSR